MRLFYWATAGCIIVSYTLIFTGIVLTRTLYEFATPLSKSIPSGICASSNQPRNYTDGPVRVSKCAEPDIGAPTI